MAKVSFYEGLEVYYKEMYGIIRFISDSYITICIRTFPNERVRDTCLVVYPDQFKDIILAKESTK